MELETKFLRLHTAVTLGSRFGDWQVCWLGGWNKHRFGFMVMVVRSLALLNDGTVRVWGEGNYGELGNGLFGIDSPTPVAVSGLSGVVAIARGSYHNLALLGDGTVRAWGFNAWGQLGDGTTMNRATP